MFMQMAERQADVVEALLDTIKRDDWSHAFVHAEFGDDADFPDQYKEGFLVVAAAGGATRAPLMVETEVGDALEAMRAAYAAAGQGFSRLDLVLPAEGSYRFALDDRPSLILAGLPDPEAKGRLDRRFAELVRGEGL